MRYRQAFVLALGTLVLVTQMATHCNGKPHDEPKPDRNEQPRSGDRGDPVVKPCGEKGSTKGIRHQRVVTLRAGADGPAHVELLAYRPGWPSFKVRTCDIINEEVKQTFVYEAGVDNITIDVRVTTSGGKWCLIEGPVQGDRVRIPDEGMYTGEAETINCRAVTSG